MTARPRYSELPDGRSWDWFGPDDRIGCLNLLTDERAAAAARLVRTGERFPLDGAVGEWPEPSPAGRAVRPAPLRSEYELVPGIVYDDRLDGYHPQGGSQWDGFLHIADPETGTGYNGVRDASLGIDRFAAVGIAGRGLLLDLAAWSERRGCPVDWRSAFEFTAEDLLACAQEQAVELSEGTILLLRTGWETGYASLGPEERIAHSPAPGESRAPVPGLKSSVDVAALLWDRGVAAVAADNPSLEVTPYTVPLAESLDTMLLVGLGMPVGELWRLDALAARCHELGRWEFFLTSAPWPMPGGLGSPANAIAIL